MAFFKEKEDGNEENPRAFGTCFFDYNYILQLQSVDILRCEKAFLLGMIFITKSVQISLCTTQSTMLNEQKDDTFLLVADGKKQNVSYTMKGDQVTFSFADDTINGTWTGDQLLAADGSPVGWDEMQIIAGNEKPVISDETYSNALGHILYGNLESISFWGFTVLGVLIYVLGIVQIYYPDKVYFFLRRWQFQNAELSDEGRTVTVIGGMIICIIGIGVMSGLILYLIK